MLEDHNYLPGLSRQKALRGSIVHTAITMMRKPLVATMVALSSAATVGIGAYPEKRMEQHEGVEQMIDRFYFTIASLTTTSTEITPGTTREKICWMIGVMGLWGTGALTLAGLLQRAKDFAERLEKERPMTETKFLLDPTRISREDLSQLLPAHDFGCRELVSLHLPEQDNGMEIKFQSVGHPNAPSEVKLRVKMPSGDNDGGNFIHTYLFERPFFGKALMEQCSNVSGTARSHKLRWSKRRVGGRDIHVDLYFNDDKDSPSSPRSERPMTIEILQQPGDRDRPIELLPDFLREAILCTIGVTDRALGNMWPEQVIEYAYPIGDFPKEAADFLGKRRDCR